MEVETMDLDQLAVYLHRDARELQKLANRGHLPGQKIQGEWRFARAEINFWLENELPKYTAEQLLALERGPATADDDRPLLAELLSDTTIAFPLPASTRASVLKELVNLAEHSWQVYDPDSLLHAVRQREEMHSTALENGIAIPHPRRAPPTTVLGESVIALGYVPSGIPFGAPGGALTDLFFLVACTDATTHLGVLTRLSRLFLKPGFLDELRASETAAEAYRLITDAEEQLLERS